jgi:hypothetical protein
LRAGGLTVDYVYDVFISYKRHSESRQWLVEHFQPLLEYHVGLELGWSPTFFRDDQDIEAGVTWPAALGQALGNARVLVPLWTRNYFHSEWCSRELATMLARENETGLRSAQRPGGLIVPVVLHDCEDLAPKLVPIHRVALTECYNVRMRRDSPLSEKLATYISTLIAPSVAKAIREAPPWQSDWPLTTAGEFLAAVMREGPPRQTQLPRFAP